MFITQSQHRRDQVGRVKKGVVHDSGLGIVVKQSTRFDPQRMKRRYEYYYNLFYNKVVELLAQQYRDAGFEGLGQEEEPERIQLKTVSDIKMYKFSQGGDTALPGVEMPKGDMVKTLAVTGGTAAIAIANPLVGLGIVAVQMLSPYLAKIPVIGGTIGKVVSSIFGSGKPEIPWDKIRQQAREIAEPAARNAARDEEKYRIMEEQQVTKEQYIKAVEKESQQTTVFKLPEYTTGIKRGALVMALKGEPVEVRK